MFVLSGGGWWVTVGPSARGGPAGCDVCGRHVNERRFAPAGDEHVVGVDVSFEPFVDTDTPVGADVAVDNVPVFHRAPSCWVRHHQ
jgi:hypothetical protein